MGTDISEQWAPRISEENFPEGSPLISSRPAYPDPFSNATTIELGITSRTNVKIEVLDKPGNNVVTYIDKTLAPGFHKISFDPGMPSKNQELESEKIYQLHISAGDVDIRGNIKYTK